MVHAADFGAAGDGITDDTEALQHALDTGDGVLKLRKGTYRLTRPLLITLTKQGYGAVLGEGGTARLIMAGAGPALRIAGNHQGTAVPSSVKSHTWEQERFVTVNGLEIVGEHPEAVGIELYRTMQATISEVLIRNCRYGVHLIERNRNFILSHSHIYDNSEYGVFFDHCNLHQTILQGNHISYNKRAGIKSLDGDVHNLQITGNDIEYNNDSASDAMAADGEPRGAEIWFESPEGIISEVTIASNTIQATVQKGGANVRIHGGPDRNRRGACLISLTGNVLGSQTRGIELKHAMRVTIVGNTLYDADHFTLHAVDCGGLVVGQNTVAWRADDAELPLRDGFYLEDCELGNLQGLVAERLGAGTTEQGGAISLVRCREMIISGCQIIDPVHRGIELEDCHRCQVTGNTILDRRTPPTMQHAIRSLRGSGNLIQQNLVGGATVKPIEIDAKTGVKTGNQTVDPA